MPIKGLTDRGLAFPEIGQIRKGAKKGENRPGADLTYFRVEFDELEVKAAADFVTAYKDKPTAIRIILPFNEIERMWDAWLEAYTAGRMIARSDGEFITYMLDDESNLIVHNSLDKNGNKVPHPANGIAGKDYKGNIVKFKPTGRLKVMIPELARAAYLTVMTTSTHDIMNISSQLAAFKELNNGQLAGIPFILRRRPKSVSTPAADGQRVRRVKSLISIEVDPDWAKAKFGQLNALALPSGFDVHPTEDVIEVDEDEVTDSPDWTDTPEEWEEKPPVVVEPVSKAMPREASLGSITQEEEIQDDTPEIRAELKRTFSQKFNAAIKKVDAKKLPKINGSSTAKEISKAIVAIDEAVAT